MATVVIFEDHFAVRTYIARDLEAGGHQLLAEAGTIGAAHLLLGRMAAGEVQADYSLVDGTLGKGEQPVFRFTPPGHELLPTSSAKGWRKMLRRSMPQRQNPHEIIVPPDDSPLPSGEDGRQIIRIIRACKIATTIIGISSDSADTWNGEVDHDLTKYNLNGLLGLISRLEAKKHKES